MALIDCPDCRGKLSTAAASCPHCGYRPPHHRMPLLHTIPWPLLVAAVLLGTWLLMYALPQYAFIIGILGLITAARVVLRRRQPTPS